MQKKLHIALGLGLALGMAGAASLVSSARADSPPQGYAPDPTPIASPKQWLFRIEVKAGKVALGPVTAKMLDKAESTPRMIGRYALELWVGKELLDRVRFNVPGAGDGPSRDDKNVLKRPVMDRINTHFTVRLADNPRATFLKFVDRATGEEETLSWPASEGALLPLDDGKRDAGTPDAGRADAGRGDAGSSDAGSSDAGSNDAGTGDAGSRDGGKPDGGPDDGGYADANPAPPYDGGAIPLAPKKPK